MAATRPFLRLVLSQVYGHRFGFAMTTAMAEPPGSTRSFDSFRASTLPGALNGLVIGKFVYDHQLRIPSSHW